MLLLVGGLRRLRTRRVRRGGVGAGDEDGEAVTLVEMLVETAEDGPGPGPSAGPCSDTGRDEEADDEMLDCGEWVMLLGDSDGGGGQRKASSLDNVFILVSARTCYVGEARVQRLRWTVCGAERS